MEHITPIVHQIEWHGVKYEILTRFDIHKHGVAKVFWHIFNNYAGLLSDACRAFCFAIIGKYASRILPEDTPVFAKAIMDKMKGIPSADKNKFVIACLRMSPAPDVPLCPYVQKKGTAAWDSIIDDAIAKLVREREERRRREQQEEVYLLDMYSRWTHAINAREEKWGDLQRRREAHDYTKATGIGVTEDMWPPELRYSSIGM